MAAGAAAASECSENKTVGEALLRKLLEGAEDRDVLWLFLIERESASWSCVRGRGLSEADIGTGWL